MTAGPFAGGLLTKIGFGNAIFNGYTSPGWLMACVWIVFWICVVVWFEDVPSSQSATLEGLELPNFSDDCNKEAIVSSEASEVPTAVTLGQWGVIICMCWFAMTCFFILGK